MLLHALYERLCTAALNRLPCYGALEVIAHYYCEISRVRAMLLMGVTYYATCLSTAKYN